MIAMLAQAAVEAAPVAPSPDWLSTVLGVLAVVSGAGAFSQWRAKARALKRAALIGAEVLDALDGEDTPEERRAFYDAFLARHGADPEFTAALAARSPRSSGPPAGVAGALLLALVLGASGCVGARVEETAKRARTTNARVRTLFGLYRAAVTPATPALAPAVKAAADEVAASLDEEAAALAAVEEAAR